MAYMGMAYIGTACTVMACIGSARHLSRRCCHATTGRPSATSADCRPAPAATPPTQTTRCATTVPRIYASRRGTTKPPINRSAAAPGCCLLIGAPRRHQAGLQRWGCIAGLSYPVGSLCRSTSCTQTARWCRSTSYVQAALWCCDASSIDGRLCGATTLLIHRRRCGAATLPYIDGRPLRVPQRCYEREGWGRTVAPSDPAIFLFCSEDVSSPSTIIIFICSGRFRER